MTLTLLLNVTNAMASECHYFEREKTGPFFEAMPTEIVGALDCQPQLPDVTTLMVAKLPQMDRDSVRKFVLKFAPIFDITAISSSVVWESQNEPMQLIVRSESPRNSNGAVIAVIHYAFVANNRLFIHSVDSGQMEKSKASLEKVKFIANKLDLIK